MKHDETKQLRICIIGMASCSMQGDQQMPGLGTFPVYAVVVQLDVGNGAVDLQSLGQGLAQPNQDGHQEPTTLEGSRRISRHKRLGCD